MGAKSLVPLTCISQICNPLWGITHRMMGENNPNWSEILREKKKGDMFITTNPNTFARHASEDFFSEDIEKALLPEGFQLLELSKEDLEDLSFEKGLSLESEFEVDEEYLEAWRKFVAEQSVPTSLKGRSMIFIPHVIEKNVLTSKQGSKANHRSVVRSHGRRGRNQAPGISDRVRSSEKALALFKKSSETLERRINADLIF